MSTGTRTAGGSVLLHLLLAGALSAQAAPAAEETCAECHGQEGVQLAAGVHAEAGITCLDCHGGVEGTIDEKAAHGSDLRPLKDAMAAVQACAHCHADVKRMRGFGLRTDQESLYWTSQHGMALKEKGDQNVATCVTCHGAHEVHPPSDPRSPVHKLNQVETCGRCHADADLMGKYGIDPEIVEQYRDSVHGRALLEGSLFSGAACSDCHGSHGATPPRVEEIGRVCGSCHSVVEGYFEQSPHREALMESSVGECASCHGAHGVTEASADMFEGTGRGHCANCHTGEDDEGLKLAATLHEDIEGLDDDITEAEARVEDAAQKGLFLEKETGYLQDVRGLQARARAMTHAMKPDLLGELLNSSHAMVGETLEGVAIKERGLRDRRIFSVLFLAVCGLLAAVLQVYRMEAFRHWRSSRSGPDGPEREV